jgi:hypothetical protein
MSITEHKAVTVEGDETETDRVSAVENKYRCAYTQNLVYCHVRVEFATNFMQLLVRNLPRPSKRVCRKCERNSSREENSDARWCCLDVEGGGALESTLGDSII